MKKLFFIASILISFLSISNVRATQYTWTGTTSTSWGTTSNWSPTGSPSTIDTVTISTHTNMPALTEDVTVKKLTLTSGIFSVGTRSLTVTATTKLNGGQITSSSGGIIYMRGDSSIFVGTQMHIVVNTSCKVVLLAGTEFFLETYLEQNGNTGVKSEGGNIFDSKVTIVNSGTGFITLSDQKYNIFNDSTFFISSSGESITLSDRCKTYFNGNVIVNCTGGNIYFGTDASDSVFLASGKKITKGSIGFTRGTLLLKNFYQLGSTAQSLTFSGSAILNILNSTFNGTVNFSSPGILLRSSTFNDSALFTKSGDFSCVSYGGNTFNGYAKFTNHSNYEFKLAGTVGDIYKKNVKYIKDYDYPIYFAYNGLNYYYGDIELQYSNALDYFSGGKIIFSGDLIQHVIGKAVNFQKVTLNKTGGYVQADTSIIVSDSLIFMFGNLNTTSNHLLTLYPGCKVTGASNLSFVDGPVKKIGNTAFVFPVGNINFYRPLEISAPSTLTDAFTAQYFHDGQAFTNHQDTTLGQLSGCNYWSFNRNYGSSNVSIALSWDSIGCTIYDTATIKIAYLGSKSWNDLGKKNLSGDDYKGKTWNNASLTGFGYFTLAYYNQIIAPITPEYYADLGDATKNHELASEYYGYNGGRNTNSTWYDLATSGILNDKNVSTIRIPFGTGGNYWDWREGWYIPEKDLPNNWFYLTNSFKFSNPSGKNEMQYYKTNADLIAAKTIFNLNLLTSDFYYQIASLYRAGMLNIPVKYIELGNEFYLNQEHYIDSYNDAKAYMNQANQWSNDLKHLIPFGGTQLAIIGAIGRTSSPGRQGNWLNGVLTNIDLDAKIDAITLHQYIDAGHILANNAKLKGMLGKPFAPANDFISNEGELIKTFNDNNASNQLAIWLTEFNLDDDQCMCVGTWSHALFVAAMTLKYLESPLITKVVSHTFIANSIFGNIFDVTNGFDGLNANQIPPSSVGLTTTVGDFTAMGSAFNEIAAAAKNATYVKKIDFGLTSSLYNPLLYGWSFDAPNGDREIIILNLSGSDRPITLSAIEPIGYSPTIRQIIKPDGDLFEGVTGNPVSPSTPLPGANDLQVLNPSIFSETFTSAKYSLTRISYSSNPLVINLADDTVCVGSNSSVIVTGGLPPYTVDWGGVTGTTSTSHMASDFPYTAVNSSSSPYIITVTDAASNSATSNLVVNPSMGAVNVYVDKVLQSGPSTFNICKGGSAIDLSAEFTPNSGLNDSQQYSYLWTPSSYITSACSGNAFTPPFGKCISVAPEKSTYYQVYVTDGQCWSRGYPVDIEVRGSSVNAGTDINVCSSTLTTLTATYNELTPSPVYKWYAGTTYLGSGNPYTVTPTHTTTYTVQVTDNGGGTVTCLSNSDDITVNVLSCCSNAIAFLNPNDIGNNNFAGDLIHVADLGGDNISTSGTINKKITGNGPTGDILQINGELLINRYDNVDPLDDHNISFINCNIQFGENANIRIEKGTKLEFHNCHLSACPFTGKMWKGIIVDKKGDPHDPTLIIDGCVISGAKQAVYISRPADYQIQNSTFTNNYVDIAFQKYYQRSHYDSDDFSYDDKFIRNCTFTSSGSTLITPYSSVHKLAAIELNDVENIDVGDILTGSTSTNTIEKSNFGIFSTNSGFRCYNTIFNEIHNYESSGGNPSGTAIYTGEFNSFSDHTFTIGEDITDGGNTFKNALNGISIYGPANSEIHNNIFGAYVGTTANPITQVGINTSFTGDKSIRISDNNEFYDYAVGIHISEIATNSNLHIMNNQFYNGNGGTTNFDGTAIAVDNFFSQAVPDSAEISHNEIGDNTSKQGRIGIYASQIDKLVIEQNNIYYHQSTAPTTYFNGIWVENAYEPKIIQNSISNDAYHAGANEYFTGIEMDNCTYPVTICNSLSNLGYSMQYINPSLQAYIITNTMTGYDNAVYLNNGLIGVQGDINYGWGNNWDVSSSHNRAEGSTSSGLAVDWHYDKSNGVGQSNLKSIDPSSVFVARGQDANLEFDDGCNGLIIFYPRNAILGGIIADSSKYEETYETFNRYHSTLEAYHSLKTHPEYLTLDSETDASFQNWYDSVATTSIEKSDLILNYYNKGNYLQARDLNNELTSYYSQEALLDTVFKINLNHKIEAINYSHADSTKLESIAEENPLIKGVNAVISARNILFREIHDGTLTYPERKAKFENETDDFIQITIFPNPTHSKLNYLSPNDLSVYTIIIKDMLGKIIKQDAYSGSTNILNLEAGIYSIEFLKEGIVKYKSKFVKQ